ncbi:MAG: FMN-binding negative transcriptional regulator [Bacteroidota bacterium]
MLENRFDAAHSEAEWQAFLAGESFGQFVVSTDGFPLVVPTHYVYDPERREGAHGVVEFHLHRGNPVFEALAQDDRAVFAVLAADAYIPTDWNRDEGADPAWSAPTSYFAAVQALGRATIIDDEPGKAAVLNRQFARLQPEGGHHAVEPGANPFGKMLKGIRAVRLTVDDVRVKIKVGGNRTRTVQERIAAHLAERAEGRDLDARAHLVRRSGLDD